MNLMLVSVKKESTEIMDQQTNNCLGVTGKEVTLLYLFFTLTNLHVGHTHQPSSWSHI